MGETSRELEKRVSINLDRYQYKVLRKWASPIQKAFLFEAENGFINVKGKEEYFSSFISKELKSFKALELPEELKLEIFSLYERFEKYNSIPISARRRLIAKARRLIHAITRKFDQVDETNEKKINFQMSNIPSEKKIIPEYKKLNLNSSLGLIKGVGEKFLEKFNIMGIYQIRDLLKYYPRDYVDYSKLMNIQQLEAGKTATILASVRRCGGFISPKNANLTILELQIFDRTGRVKVTKFFAGRRFSNQGYIKSQVALYPPGSLVAVSGLVKDGKYGKTFSDPLIEVMKNRNSILRSKSIGRILPIYSLIEGMKADKFRETVESVLPFTKLVLDPLDDSRINALTLLSKKDALMHIHFPVNQDRLKAARRRLVFDEFLVLQLGLLIRRSKYRSISAPVLVNLPTCEGLVGKFLDILPFDLTNAQKRVLLEMQKDMSTSLPMARLLQGDVGSGKTVVALAGLIHCVQSGLQGALMVPTEVLAEQHYRSFCKWLSQLHITVELLTGSTPKKKRKIILQDLANGSLKILLGTHALIEEPVIFSNLGLVVVDEQHRFGVKQRNRLLSKGLQPHLLAMTATPIPRTLALSIHGDLDVSQLDELPPGRIPIKTKLFSSSQRHKAYQIIRDQVELGSKAYIVLPLVDESEKLDLRSAVEVHRNLTEDIFMDLNVRLLHGRMSSLDKNSVIREFSHGSCQILVSTTVIEVGMDVPKASVMMIDHADRFGLAQLHQLRGRVGRGLEKSYCLLINESNNLIAKQRLELLVASNDGFEISEFDLRFRGPGQVLGTKQSGLPDFALASLSEDASVLEEARDEAKFLLENDPDLSKHTLLKRLVESQAERLSGSVNLN